MLRITSAIALAFLLGTPTKAAEIGFLPLALQSLMASRMMAPSLAEDLQTFRPYTGLSALQLAGTMVVNPGRLETIEVVGAYSLDRVAREVGDDAIQAAIAGGQAKVAVRSETGELVSFDVSRSGLDIEALAQIDNAYFLARSPDVLPSKPDFRAIDWNAPRSVQPEG